MKTKWDEMMEKLEEITWQLWGIIVFLGFILLILSRMAHGAEGPIYVVTLGGEMCWENFHNRRVPCWEVRNENEVVDFCGKREICDDLAAALNEAHERRTHQFLGVLNVPCGDPKHELECGQVIISTEDVEMNQSTGTP